MKVNEMCWGCLNPAPYPSKPRRSTDCTAWANDFTVHFGHVVCPGIFLGNSPQTRTAFVVLEALRWISRMSWMCLKKSINR